MKKTCGHAVYSSKGKFILGESLPFIYTYSTNRYKHCDNPLLYFVPLNLWCVLIKVNILPMAENKEKML
jgi:hypothetical protein